MIKISKNSIPLFLLFFCLGAKAQVTSSSPYSRFGLGTLKGPYLPQNRSMGSISTGIRSIGFYNNINLANPASYSGIKLTTFDVGAFSAFTGLSTNSVSQPSNFNAALSHLVFAVPVTKKSAISFGLLPYSDLGYKYQTTSKLDTNTINHVYAGQGGLSKAYLGYGREFGKNFSVGLNLSYIFGKLQNSGSTEFPDDLFETFRNSRTTSSSSISGLTIDYGLQYYKNINDKIRFTVGYSGTKGSKLNSSSSVLSTHYYYVYDNALDRDRNKATETLIDTTFFSENPKQKIKLPASNSVGFTIENQGKWMLGSDFTTSSWSNYREGASNPGLNNSYSLKAGGQITPDPTAVSNYFKLVDYRFGLRYDKTYIKVKNTDIKEKALTFGLGLPLPSNRGVSFYKVNFSTELSQLGSLQNGLVRERHVNFYIGFTLNDSWFQKFKFD